MKKFISAVTSLAMTVTMASSIAPSVSAADASKGFAIKAYAEAGSKYDAMGSKVTVSKDDIAAGDVVVPVAVYLDEATNDSEAVSVSVKLVSDSADVKNVTFKRVNPNDEYFAEAKEYTAGTKTFSTKNAVIFAGEVSRRGAFVPAGSWEIAADTSQKEAGADNAYIGCSWTNNGSAYEFIGSKSTDHPFFVFDVTLPKGTAAGDYKLEFCRYNTDTSGQHNNPTPMIETKAGRFNEDLKNLNLEEMTITVEGSNATTSETTTAKPVETTTAAPTTTVKPAETTTAATTSAQPVADADVIFDFGNYEAKAGDEVTVDVTVDSKNKAISAMDVVFAIDSPLTIDEIDKQSLAFKTTAMTNIAILGANFKSLDDKGEPLVPTKDPVFTLYVTVPATTPDGVYNVGFGNKCEVHKSNDGSKYSSTAINGKIKVGNPVDDPTTSATTASQPATTTTSATTASQPTSTTTQPVANADVIFDFGNYEAKAGDEVTVDVTVDSKNKAISAMDVVFAIDSPLTIDEIDKQSLAFKTTAMTNIAILGANFKSLDDKGEPLVPTKDPVFTLYVTVPATTPDGVYNVGFGNKCEVHKSNDGSKYSSTAINGKIKVGNPVDDPTTSATTASQPATTTSSTTASQPAETTTTVSTPSGNTLKPVWGDVNCDGDVNVADVVLLNKWLNNNADYAMTDQGKVNADCFNPQDANGGAVDASKVDLTKADSDAIIKSVVHLITLPAKG